MCKSIWNTNCIVCLHPCHFATNRKGLHELLRHLLVREEEHRLELFSLLLARLAAAPPLHHHLLVLAPVCPSLPPQRLQATRSPGSDNATASSRCMPAQYALNHASSSCCACCACCACLPFCVCRTAMATPHTPLAASPPNVTSTTDSCRVLASPTTYRSSPARPTTTSPISSSSAERCTTQKSYGSHGPPEPTDASRAVHELRVRRHGRHGHCLHRRLERHARHQELRLTAHTHAHAVRQSLARVLRLQRVQQGRQRR